MVLGAIIFDSSLTNYSADLSCNNLVFVGNNTNDKYSYIGFDYANAGREIAKKISKKLFKTVALLSSKNTSSKSQLFFKEFKASITTNKCKLMDYTISNEKIDLHTIFNNINDKTALVTDNYEHACEIDSFQKEFFSTKDVVIFSISHFFNLPEPNIIKYELDYHLLGEKACKKLLEKSKKTTETIENYGFRKWKPPAFYKTKKTLNVIMLDAPEEISFKTMTEKYINESNVKINIDTHSYNDMISILSSQAEIEKYDIIRLDGSLLPMYSKSILLDITTIDHQINDYLNQFIGKTVAQICSVNNSLFAIPYSLSSQVLFYRKDIFEDSILRRIYKETYKENLNPPENFEQYNQIAEFFTQSKNKRSPTRLGAILTLGNYGVISSEFLMRYFSNTNSFFQQSGGTIDFNLGKNVLENMAILHRLNFFESSHWWRDSAKLFAKGETAMITLYSNFAAELTKQKLFFNQNIDFVNIPGNNPLVGGGVLGICKYAKDPQLALEFVKWLCSGAISTASTSLGGASVNYDTYKNRGIYYSYPWMELVEKGLSHSNCLPFIPQTNNHLTEIKLMKLIGNSVKGFLNSEYTAEEAMYCMQKEINESSI